MKIGHKLTLGFLVVALLVGVVGYLAINASQKALQESIGESSVSLAVGVLDEIDRGIYNKIERFQSFQDPSLQETIAKSNQEFEKLDDIQSYINEKDKEWTSAPKQEITPFMKDLINKELSKALRKRAEFYEEKHGLGVFAEVFVTNKYGANVGQTGKTTDYRQDDEEWWQWAKKDGLYVADVEYDESAKVYSTDIGMRIDDENGNFIGVIKVVLSIEEAINIIKKAEATIKYDTTQFKLLTKDKKVIYSTEEFRFLEDASDELLSAFEQEKEHVGYFIAKGDKPDKGGELFAHAHSEGYGDYKDLGWILIIKHTTEEILAPVAQLRTHILIITLAITAFAIVLGLFISKSISNPVSKLAIAAAEIGKGNLDYKVGIGTKDEVGQLSRAFDKMTENLKATTTSIDSLNREITERKKANEKIRKLAKFPSENPNPVLRVTKEGKVLYSNAAGQLLLAKWRSEVGGVVPEQWRRLIAEAFKPGKDKSKEEEIRDRIFSLVIAPVVDAGYANLYAQDITERRRAEESLKQAAREWRTTFDSISDLVSIHDKDFKLVRVNKAFADAVKMEPAEVIGKTCYELVHGTKGPPASCLHKQTLDTQKPHSAEFFDPHLGIYLEVSGSPMFDENGEVIAVVHITKDITERKCAEERQAMLFEEVERINQELKDFAYIVSHDLKAPLRGVKTLADWISADYADKLGDEGREQMDLLLSQVKRMHNLIDGVLEYSRVGCEKEEQVQINLNGLVREAIDMVAPPENIEITIENELPVIEYERTRIMQVFQNLLSNAVKYMDKPQGRVRIGCVEEDGFWKFSVADNGPGIEEKHFERIFKIFQTLSPRDEFESTGVGLTVIKKIVELYDGKIWVESEPGKGSTFFFTLPKKEIGIKDAKREANIACRR